jgi:quinone-modifying oxidoreductase subunit QmoB
MEKKFGVYICKGCGIAEAVDIEKLSNVATKDMKMPFCKTHDVLCSPDGVRIIKDDIANEGVNTITIAACSPRVKYDVFDFPGTITERVNIREFVAWSQEPNNEETQSLAGDYLTMGIVRTQKGDMPEPNILDDLSSSILVIGGGISGMTAALSAANAGSKVVLVEKEPKLGGFINKLYKKIPTGEYKEPLIVDAGIDPMINEVETHPNIKVYKSARVEKTDGQPGLYNVTISSNGSSETIKIGAIVLAAGWKPYDANKLDHLGYGKFRDVITSIELEEIARKSGNNGRITRPSDGKEAKKVAFIQCAGSRDPNHLPYCSSMCCATSLKQAKYVRQNPDALAMILYRDIRTPGRLEYYYKEAQNDPGVMMTKGDVIGVTDAGNGNLFVEMENSLLGEKVKIEADLVVLATGVVPATRDPQVYLDGITQAAAKGDDAKKAYLESTPKPEFILNLTYRQGPELPSLEGAYGFADSNFICFQYETRRTGIYAAGCVRQPMNMAEAQDDGAGAAFKAIQCVDHAARGIAVHPRAWDVTFPDPQLIRCTACKRCTEECPFGAIDEDEKGIPYYKINRCRRCGTCMGACPERIVSFKDYSVDIIGSMIKSLDVPEEEFRIVALACEHDAYPALDTAGINRKKIDSSVRFISLRCLGGMNLVWVADALSKGVDGVLLLGCKFGENYQCHFVTGSELANYRFGKVGETLNRLQLESERVQMLQVSISEYDKLPDMINEFVARVKEIGPNPFKGF